MRTYIILLHRMQSNRNRAKRSAVEVDVWRSAERCTGIELLDILTCSRTCDAVLLCRAPDNQKIDGLLNGLDGWRTEALLANSHLRY